MKGSAGHHFNIVPKKLLSSHLMEASLIALDGIKTWFWSFL